MRLNTPSEISNALKYLDAIGFTELPITVPDPLKIRIRALGALKTEAGGCTQCALSERRKGIVFGEGDPMARLMFIGEAPGREETANGKPFVGEAGELLTRIINKMGFKREDVYIVNIVKCRPPQDRDPKPGEMAACLPFIRKQIEIISPGAIMALGRVSSHALIETDIPISKLRGRMQEFMGIPLMPTFHPTYLIKNRSQKQKTWEDAQQVMALLDKGETR